MDNRVYAFPLVNDSDNDQRSFVNFGMTLWDYFAAHALEDKTHPQFSAQRAALVADAMMEERKKRGIK